MIDTLTETIDDLDSVLKDLEQSDAGSGDLDMRLSMLLGAEQWRPYSRLFETATSAIPHGWFVASLRQDSSGNWRCLLMPHVTGQGVCAGPKSTAAHVICIAAIKARIRSKLTATMEH